MTLVADGEDLDRTQTFPVGSQTQDICNKAIDIYLSLSIYLSR